jgi:hypothetical protein
MFGDYAERQSIQLTAIAGLESELLPTRGEAIEFRCRRKEILTHHWAED